MSVKIRLQRHGKKGKPFYHIVVADARARRDGRFIEKLGTYNPVANPAIIDLNVDAAVKWLNDGAQPTDTAKAILSYKGALYKKHLQGGVAKGAFDQLEADKRFVAWLDNKEEQVKAKKDGLSSNKSAVAKAKLENEVKVNEARIAAALKVEQDLIAATEAENAAAQVVEVTESAAEVVEVTESAAEVVEATESAAEDIAGNVEEAPETPEA